MSEEKLTVAELMARAGREAPAADKTRRRRRRSLDEGGISVADLTDGFSRVEASGPRRGAHAADDDDDDQQGTPAATESDAAAEPTEPEPGETVIEETEIVAEQAPEPVETSAAPEAEVEPEVGSVLIDETVIDETVPDESAEYESEVTEVDDVVVEPEYFEQPEQLEQPEDFVEPEQPEPLDQVDTPEPAEQPVVRERRPGFIAGVPEAVPVNPVVSSVENFRDEVTFTFTALRDSETVTTEVAEPGSAVQEILEDLDPDEASVEETVTEAEPAAPTQFDHEITGVIPQIEDEDGETGEIVEPSAAPTETVEAVGFDEEFVDGSATTAGFDDYGEHDDFRGFDDYSDFADESEHVAAPGSPEGDYFVEEHEVDVLHPGAEAETGFDEELERDQVALGAEAETGFDEELEQDIEPERRGLSPAVPVVDEEDSDEDNSLSVPLLILQVFVGVIAGVFLFILFAMLWSALPTIAMVAIGLVVTGIMVLAANALRRKSDRMTPVLAGIVGLAITFGPYLVQLL